MKTRSKVLLATTAAAVMVLGGTGTAYATHFQDRALPGSTLGGVSVAGMTRDEVAQSLQQRADAVTVTVTAGGTTRTEHLADLGYSVDVGATVDAVFGPNASWSSYATSLVSSRDVQAVVTEDAATVDDVVSGLVQDADKAGANAKVVLAPDAKSFDVTPAVTGKTVVPSSFQAVVSGAARTLTSSTAHVRFVDAAPAITTADAQKVADEANFLVARSVVVSVGGEKQAASATEKASWVTIPRTSGTLGSPTVDSDAVRSWVDGLAADANTEPTNGVRYVDSAGTVRLVRTQAVDGRSVSNAGDVASGVVAALGAGKDYAGGFDFTTLPATWDVRRIAAGAENLAYPAADGEKWIDVNLSAHTMTAYVGAKAVYGPISMVNGADATPTVVGTFHIYSKTPSMTMRGNNADGTTYETPDVPWVSFFYSGYALHGAYWRSTYGYSDSHGCINLPVDVAKWVYDFAPIGTPVVTHH